MDKTLLVEKDFTEGADFIRFLDESNFDVHSALWLYNPDQNYWRFLIATPLVDDYGQKRVYTKLRNIIAHSRARAQSFDINLSQISVISPNHPLIRVLRSAIQTGRSISTIRFSRNTINNTYIDDAVIYRLQ